MTQEEKFSRIVELMSVGQGEELSAWQAAELESLLDTPELRAMAREMADGTGLSRRLERYGDYPAEAAFRKFVAATRRERRKAGLHRVAKLSAAALLAFAAAAGLWLVRNAERAGDGIVPATRHAMLVAGADDRFELSARDTVLAAANATAVIRGGEIIFDAPADATQDEVTQYRMEVPRGGIYTVTLCDGTRVVLNADSELGFPSAFSDSARVVTMRGEGYFEVAEDAARPFIIHTDDRLDVRVFGTKFNVTAYDDLGVTRVTLVEGSVGVSRGAEVVVLRPDEQAVFDRGTGDISVRMVADAAGETAWTRGTFEFAAASLDVIIATLERWYDVDISTDSVDLAALGIFSLRMDRGAAIVSILDMLNEITGLKYRIEGRDIRLYF